MLISTSFLPFSHRISQLLDSVEEVYERLVNQNKTPNANPKNASHPPAALTPLAAAAPCDGLEVASSPVNAFVGPSLEPEELLSLLLIKPERVPVDSEFAADELADIQPVYEEALASAVRVGVVSDEVVP